MFRFVYRASRKISFRIAHLFGSVITLIRLKGNGVEYGKRFTSYGMPVVDVWDGGKLIIGDDVVLNNGYSANLIGRQQPCIFTVRSGAVLTIGNNTGISATAIVCCTKVTIGNFVKIGGNTVIYDTDFHSLDYRQRADAGEDLKNTKNLPVVISDHVFIGAHSTILKGVSIGEHSIIGSGSVVTKNIPANEIWGGCPAKFIKSIV